MSKTEMKRRLAPESSPPHEERLRYGLVLSAVEAAKHALSTLSSLPTQASQEIEERINQRISDTADLLTQSVITKLTVKVSRVAKKTLIPLAAVASLTALVARFRRISLPVPLRWKISRLSLSRLEKRLNELVLGQTEGVRAVVAVCQRFEAGLARRTKPIGSFLFLGSAGVGKTKLVKALVKELFDDESMLVRVSCVTGAHPTVLDNLFQILDSGQLMDIRGQMVDFSNTMLFMTSTLGATNLTGVKNAKMAVMQEVHNHFDPRLISRLDASIVFNMLTNDVLNHIAEIKLNEVRDEMLKKNIVLNISARARDIIREVAYNPAYGARSILTWIDMRVVTLLSEMFLKKETDKKLLMRMDLEGEGHAVRLLLAPE